jgi:hypothetical protein
VMTEALRLPPIIRILVRGKISAIGKHYRKRTGICGQNRLLRTIRNFRVVRHFRTFRSTCANTCGMYQMTHLRDGSGFPTRTCETGVLVHVHMQMIAAEWP